MTTNDRSHKNSKWASALVTKKIVEAKKRNNESVGLCHGCFDILHYGHLRHFESAASMCDFLVVSITADRYVNKGPNRPIFPAERRAELVAGLTCVGSVLISEYASAVEILDFLQPNIFFKGQDYIEAGSNFNPNFLLEVKRAEQLGVRVIHTQEDRFSSTEVLTRLESISNGR